MPLESSQPSLNPTVEEEENEMDTEDPQNSATESRLSWSEICSQHDSVLASHLALLDRVKTHADPDGDAFRVLSSMLEKTNKLVTQFEIIKKRIIPRLGKYTASGRRNGARSRPDTTSFRHDDGANSSRDRRKRSRIDRPEMEMSGVEYGEQTASIPPADAGRGQKRKRLDLIIPGGDEDARNALPVALETEDISEEVRRRLQIKEEQRKKRNSQPEKKRKRDSLASNASTSSTTGMTKARKKFKMKR